MTETERSVPTATALNAFSLLAAEEAVGDHQAEEALFLTFNVDLGFFEARVLGLTQASGARVTVVADAKVWNPDPRSVRHAGRSYHVGLFSATHAFHPKLVLLVGPQRALAVIGSGNLTMGGWQYNCEIATAFTGDGEGMPVAFSDLARLLRAFGQEAGLDPVAAAGVQRAVGHLDGLLTRAQATHRTQRVFASWEDPLINAIPDGRVDELLLSAPFHDPRSAAVDRLIERLRPGRVRVAIQPGWTVIEPEKLATVLDGGSSASEVLEDPLSQGKSGARYRHGKLIEWVVGEERWTLTGSPNLSAAALLNRGGVGGNYELAVLSEGHGSLFPGGEPLDLSAQQPHRIEASETETHDSSSTPFIIAALMEAGTVTVYFSRDHDGPLELELSDRGSSPDEWLRIAQVPPSVQQLIVSVETVGGSRMRLVSTDADGVRWPGSPTFVTDKARILYRPLPTDRASRTQRAVPLDLFGDDYALLSAVAADLPRYVGDIAATHKPRVADGTSTEERASSGRTDAGEPWLWLQNETRAGLGPALTAFALGLPTIGNADSAIVPWADKLTDEAQAGLDDDTVETVTELAGQEEEPARDLPLDHTNDGDRLRAIRRKWARTNTERAEAVTIPSRMFILRMTLLFWSAGNWTLEDTEPTKLVAALLHSVDRRGIPPQLEPRLGSLVAVALVMLRLRTDLSSHNEQAMAYRSLVSDLGHLLLASEREALGEFVGRLKTPLGRPLEVEEVSDFVGAVSQDDGLAEILASLEGDGHEVSRPGQNQLLLHGAFSNPEPIALRAVGRGEELARVAVWAANDRGDWALCVWSKPNLVTVLKQGERAVRWRHQVLPSLVGPAAVARMYSPHEGTQFQVLATPRHSPTAAARGVLAELGIVSPEPPEKVELLD